MFYMKVTDRNLSRFQEKVFERCPKLKPSDIHRCEFYWIGLCLYFDIFEQIIVGCVLMQLYFVFCPLFQNTADNSGDKIEIKFNEDFSFFLRKGNGKLFICTYCTPKEWEYNRYMETFIRFSLLAFLMFGLLLIQCHE